MDFIPFPCHLHKIPWTSSLEPTELLKPWHTARPNGANRSTSCISQMELLNPVMIQMKTTSYSNNGILMEFTA